MNAFIKLYIKSLSTFCMMCVFVISCPAQAASFDCAKANTKVEKMICGDAELSKLDGELSGAYIHVLVRNENKQVVTQNQKQWLKEVRNACQDRECLKDAYEERIRALIVNEWQKEVVVQEVNLPAPACTTKQAPEYCTWTQEKLLTSEQHIVDEATKAIKKIILPNLHGAEWIPYESFDPTNQKIEAFCTAKLIALREGRVNFFPQPQAKSSQIGFLKLKQQREEKAKRENCDKGKGAYAIFDTYLISYAEWLYELPNGHARLFLNPSAEAVRLTAASEQCNAIVGLAESIISQTDPTRSGAGFFKEQAIGLVEIEGELFGIEGGVMIMDGDINRWKNDTYFAIWDKTYDMGEASGGNWETRILALYPLNPPWKEYYRQLNLPSEKKALWEKNNRAYDKPCMWNIQN